jgi:glycosyltransferase involved in cell wall biosynthesis
VPAKRIAVIRNGIDVPHPSLLRPRSDTPRICVLGRLVPHKQVEHALRVLADLQLPELRLDVIGAGWWSDELVRLATELRINDQVVFHGQVSEAERDALLDASWLMLAPSIKEGWGIAIMEAAARAVPTIAYASAGGVTESVLDGETGLLVADYPELLEQTRRLLGDHELRISMGKAARERAENFDWASSAAAFERHLQGAADQRLP